MKFRFIILLLLSSCSSNDDSADIVEEDTVLENEDNFTGIFIDVTHPTSGTATVNAEKTTLELTNFKSDDGPLLELYLTTGLDVSNYVSLGVLKGLDGNYSYTLPTDIDLETYNHVIVWCVEFSVNFGYAILK
ncbi:DM13 domain-containing protein [Formosa sediminum]|uniref:DM13 domain-containing protein n=1 Tax=Formosa sediminum TaxID=2594004 RepID=A0A516GUC3_9FLAO|nr:DM13 domain-containing protein [Formosa sediminum]QDO95108.1 DM13 domain-containing protein [Formosa sediminum]